MAVEEIVLSLPEATRESELSRLSATERDRNHNDELIGRYRQMLDARRRFAWTKRGRARREEVFEAACKNMAKQLARQSTDKVQDRASRLAARALIYGAVDGLLATAAREQQRQASQYRKALRYAFWLGSLGALMVAVLIALGLNGSLALTALV
jgi:hypothetical protein